jgi:hypothetical protein
VLAAIARAQNLDRRGVRAAFERRFTARRMAEDYVQVYRQLADHHRRTDTSAAAD